ncbi:MAG: VOC family protein [Oscillospiraceae bacterium]|nr:VOC family protein [Oscillospiraceae bacterium]
MDIKENATGIQHIGIPTNNIDTTITFYETLGFSVVLRTVNEEANEQVAFLQLGNLMIETYENHQAAMQSGAIDHIAIDVKDIASALEFVNAKGMNNTNDVIHFIPFWENGVKFFKIEGPNKEMIEFSQML